MCPTNCDSNTDRGPNLVRADVPCHSWLDSVHHRNVKKILGASDKILTVSGTISLHSQIKYSRTHVTFSIVGRLAAPSSLGTVSINKSITSINPAKREAILQYSPHIPYRLLQKATIAAKKDKSDSRQEIQEDLSLFVTPTPGGHRIRTATRQVLLKVMCDMLVLVVTKGTGLVDLIPHEFIAKTQACITGEGIVDV